MKLNILRKTKLKLIAFILSNKSYGGIEYTVNKIPNIIDDFFISEDSKDEHILEIVKKNNYKLIYNNKLSGYGSNVKNSLRYAFNELKADYAIEIHGDHGQFDPSATYDAIKYLNNNYDFISGSRFLKFKENMKYCLRNALMLAKQKLPSTREVNNLIEIAKMAFGTGEIDGIRTLIEFTKKNIELVY